MDTVFEFAWRLAVTIIAPTLFWLAFRTRRPSKRARLRQQALDRINGK